MAASEDLVPELTHCETNCAWRACMLVYDTRLVCLGSLDDNRAVGQCSVGLISGRVKNSLEISSTIRIVSAEES